MTPPSSYAFAPAERSVSPRFRAERAVRLMVGALVAIVLTYGFG